MREHTPTQSDDLYDLVSDRAIAAKPLILTSNRAPKDRWYPLFPNPVVAESLLDRRSSTPATKSSWTVRPTDPGNDPAARPPGTHSSGSLRSPQQRLNLRNYVTATRGIT